MPGGRREMGIERDEKGTMFRTLKKVCFTLISALLRCSCRGLLVDWDWQSEGEGSFPQG